MKLLITGAGGFVGSAVAHQAIKSGHEVVCTVREGSQTIRLDTLAGRIRIASLDLRDSAAVSKIINETRPDVVIHSGWSGVSNQARFDRSQISDNIDAACSLVDACSEFGVSKFVGVGSQGEYGLCSGKISEDMLPAPKSLYGASKLAVLHLTRQLSEQAGLSFAWLRLFSTYGPGDKPNWLIPSLIEQMLSGVRPKTTLGTQLWDYLYIDDVACGILAAAVETAAQGVFNLGSGQPRKVREIVEIMRDLAAPEMELMFGEIPYRADQVWHMEADIKRLQAATGWMPQITLEAGLARTVAWHQAQRKTENRAP